MTSLNSSHLITDQETWQMAMEWVRANKHLVSWTALPFLRYMAADNDDLFQEAIIAAFEALIVSRNKQAPQRFIPFFRVIFKTHCLRLATGIPTSPFLNDTLPHSSFEQEEDEEGFPEPFQSEIEEALQSVGGRRREVCTWILEQAQPVSTMETAQHFKVSQRQVRRLLHKTIEQLTKAA